MRKKIIITFLCIAVFLLFYHIGITSSKASTHPITPANSYTYSGSADIADINEYAGYLIQWDWAVDSIIDGLTYSFYYKNQQLSSNSSLPADRVIVSYSPVDQLYNLPVDGSIAEIMSSIFNSISFNFEIWIYCNGDEIYNGVTKEYVTNIYESYCWTIDLSETIPTVATGVCGKNLTWVLDGDGVLTITGTGEMYDYTDSNSPFAGNGQITKVTIRADGITSIGDNAFRNCSNLERISIGQNITSIGSYAFFGCNQLSYVYYPDSDKHWRSIEIGNHNDPLHNAPKDYLIMTISGRQFINKIEYYTGNWESTDYLTELADLLCALSSSVYNYKNIKLAYDSLGFNSFDTYDYDGDFNPYRCGYSLGFKKNENETICLVVVRGSSNDSDWIGNLSLITTSDGKHTGFALPAKSIYQNIQTQISDQHIKGKVKYVLTGHSRGAAVANLLAVELMENGISESDIYDYNFACPDVASKIYFSDYNNIFNLCNLTDPVPYLPGFLGNAITNSFNGGATTWGKFGQTYWFAKSALNTVSPFENHQISLYLEFFNERLNPSKWKTSYLDCADDIINDFVGWVAEAFCPVDILITDTDGNRIASVIDGEINYYNSSFGDVIILTDGDKKVIYIKGDNQFNVDLIGTNDGTMTYSIEKISFTEGEVLESKTFTDVKLEEGKVMSSPISDVLTPNDVELYVMEEEGGETIISRTIHMDGTENEVIQTTTFFNKIADFFHSILTFFFHLFGKM